MRIHKANSCGLVVWSPHSGKGLWVMQHHHAQEVQGTSYPISIPKPSSKLHPQHCLSTRMDQVTSVATSVLEEASVPVHTACVHQTSLWGTLTVKTLLTCWTTISHSALNKYLLKASKCQEVPFMPVLVQGGDTSPCPHLVHTLARMARKGRGQLNYILDVRLWYMC